MVALGLNQWLSLGFDCCDLRFRWLIQWFNGGVGLIVGWYGVSMVVGWSVCYGKRVKEEDREERE